MGKKWKIFLSDVCPKCNRTLLVYTDCAEEDDTEFEQFFKEGDTVKCYQCSFRTKITVEYGEVGLKYYDDLDKSSRRFHIIND